MNNRLARVCEVIKRELGILITREFEFGGTLVTVTSVDITPDLKQAHVFVSALGPPGSQRKVLEMLNDRRVMFQTEMSKRIRIKHTPHLHFRIDEAMERATRVINLMNQLGLEEEPPTDDENEL
jgi:ribosome-binding factor A